MTNSNSKEIRPLKDDRSILKFFIFGCLTLGIYEIWYIYGLIKDVKYLLEDEDTPLPSFFTYMIYSIFTLGIYNVYYWLKVSDLMKNRAIRRKLNIDISSGFMAFCFILGYFVGGITTLVSYHTIFEAMNILAEDYNRTIRYN